MHRVAQQLRIRPRQVLFRIRARRIGPGHPRLFVGGRWDELGRLQLDFLRDRGLRPEHVLLDIACGALRGGVHFIPYLGRGNYLGLDRREELIRHGLNQELPAATREDKQPEFVVSDCFEFARFSKVADVSWAHSLFTHLTLADIERCCARLREYVVPGHEFYATFWLGQYSPDELAEIGSRTGWQPHYIGDWGHPRGQKMMQFTARG